MPGRPCRFQILIRPVCSTMKNRSVPSPALVMNTGSVRPRTRWSSAISAVVGPPSTTTAPGGSVGPRRCHGRRSGRCRGASSAAIERAAADAGREAIPDVWRGWGCAVVHGSPCSTTFGGPVHKTMVTGLWPRDRSSSSCSGSWRRPWRSRSSSSTRPGDLVFLNEAAEGLLGIRFDDIDELPLEEWSTGFRRATPRRHLLPPEETPLVMALRERRPCHQQLIITGIDGVDRSHRGDGLPARGRSWPAHRRRRDVLGAEQDERREGDVLGHARLDREPRAHRPRATAATRPASRSPPTTARASILDAGTGIRALGEALPRDDGADRHPPEPSPHGPHPGPRLLRAVLHPGSRGPRLGSAVGDARPPGRLSRYLSPPLFPVRLRDVESRAGAAQRARPSRRGSGRSRSPPRRSSIRGRRSATGSRENGSSMAYLSGSRASARRRRLSRRAGVDVRARPCGRASTCSSTTGSSRTRSGRPGSAGATPRRSRQRASPARPARSSSSASTTTRATTTKPSIDWSRRPPRPRPATARQRRARGRQPPGRRSSRVTRGRDGPRGRCSRPAPRPRRARCRPGARTPRPAGARPARLLADRGT